MTDTRIEWTDATWNPVAGCSIISAGCNNCYAMQMTRRLEAMGVEKYAGLTRKSGPNAWPADRRAVWNGKVREDWTALKTPYNWRKPKKIFVNSMSDLFHGRVSDEFMTAVWRVMYDTPRHTYQILTKRAARMAAFMLQHQYPPFWRLTYSSIRMNDCPIATDPLPNVWLGVSVENAAAVSRIGALRNTPAAVRFVSFEPLIGPVGAINLEGIHWAIVGGESGQSARPIREEWIDEIHGQCLAAGTAFFFKQWGTWGQDNKRRSKKANGRDYRGQTWDEMPVAALI